MDIYFRRNNQCFNFRVGTLIKVADKILLTKHDNYFTLPGGRVRFGETTEQAIKREIFTKLGVDIEIIRLMSINENFFAYGEDDYHEVLFIYLCEVREPIKMQETNVNEYQFVSISDLMNINLKPEFLLEEVNKLPVEITHNVINK